MGPEFTPDENHNWLAYHMGCKLYYCGSMALPEERGELVLALPPRNEWRNLS